MSDTSDRIEREIVIAAPVERVWELLTRPEHVGRLFGDAGAEIDLRPGGATSLSWEEHGTVHERVERVEPPTAFAYRWAPFREPGGQEPVAGSSTLIESTLAAAGEGTRLRVVESGFAGLDATPEKRLALREGNVEGCEIELGHFAEYAHVKV
jgi:uncharacterized protein YndB with AHSA1/START domain